MSTESRPVDYHQQRNALVFTANPVLAPTITSSTSRRIRTGTAALGAVEFPSNSRSYRWERRRKSWFTEGSGVEPEGYHWSDFTRRGFLQENAS
jgi:hypothetical protein